METAGDEGGELGASELRQTKYCKLTQCIAMPLRPISRHFTGTIGAEKKIDKQAEEIRRLKEECKKFEDRLTRMEKHIRCLESKEGNSPDYPEKKVNYNGK